ncbi:carbon-nitrogen hydrolase [Thermothelomyces heterothallicus CBS 203.75]
MRIACLQFSPQVGDVDDNLNRADAVLGRVDPEELDSLDLLVLPELAFTGYNFKSLQDIAPFLEEVGSGISSLWAQTTALKHDCTVVVGYPEKVDVSEKWPASPGCYNSVVIVNGEGDTVGNYRKSFLYYTDETWALEGANGFFEGEIPKLGNVALGICTDLNPYKLEAPWDAFEFGFHILKSKASLVIMSMAWQTHHDRSVFNLNPAEPDLETLVYWVQRLEPLIRADTEEELIVIFCNRAGSEEEVTYTGTSAVIGIRRGEVFVYGVLGRGVDELLIVDTDQPPMSKLTDADADAVAGDEEAVAEEKKAPDTEIKGDLPAPPILEHRHSGESEVSPRHLAGPGLSSPRQPTSPRLPWLAQPTQPGETPIDNRSPTRLQIPTRPPADEVYTAIDTAFTDDDIIIDTPAMAHTPAFARRLQRPTLAIPASPGWRCPSKQSPYPWQHHDGSYSSVFGAGATMTPITPFDEDGWSSTPIDQKVPPQWFWRHEPTLSALKESAVEEEEEKKEEEEKEEKKEEKENGSDSPQHVALPPAQERKQDASDARTHESSDYHKRAQQAEPEERVMDWKMKEGGEDVREEEQDSAEERTALKNDWADLAQVLEGLRARPSSVLDVSSSPNDRPSSPKSRNVSRSSSPSRSLERWGPRYGGQEHDNASGGAGGPADGEAARPHQEPRQWQRQRQRQPSRLRHVVSRDVADAAGSPDMDDTTPPLSIDPAAAAGEARGGKRGGKRGGVETGTDGIPIQDATTTPSLCSATSAASTSTFSDDVVESREPVVFVRDGGDSTGSDSVADAAALPPGLVAAVEGGGKGAVDPGANGSLEIEGGSAGLEIGRPAVHG